MPGNSVKLNQIYQIFRQFIMNFSELELLLNFPFLPNGQLTLIDVGAHIGTSAYPFARKGWQVIAFEPEPENRQQLESNLRNYKNVTIIPKAVSDKAGQVVPFYVSSEHWGIHSLKPFHESHQPQLTVETVRLDETLEELGIKDVSLLKIDIEGADFLAVKSFDFYKIKPEIVMCEFMDERSQPNFGYSHHDMAKYMEEKGYNVFVSEWSPIKEYAKKGKATAPHKFLEFSRYPLKHQPAWGNLIFVRQDRIKEFEKVLSSYINTLKNQSSSATPNINKSQVSLEQMLAQYEIALKQQSYELVIDSLWKIVQNYPSYQLAAIKLSDLLLQAGKLAETRTVLNIASANSPDSKAVTERINILSYREKLLENSHKKIETFKNKHQGERCVIIGNGPSLNKMDLSFLKHEICFGLNRIYLGFEKWGFVPNYYVSVNKFVIEQSADEILKLPCTKFVSVAGLPYLSSQKDLILINSVSWKDYFSTNPREGLCIGSTVTYVTLQLAYYMGFKTAILIGVDHNFETKGTPHKLIVSQGEDPNHFHPEYFGKGVKWQLPDLEGSERMYKLADAYFKANGGQVIDATFEGYCPIFEKENYQKLFFNKEGIPLGKGGLKSLTSINEICNYAYQYQKDSNNPSILEKFRQGRLQVAKQLISLSGEELRSAYQGAIGRAYQAILKTKIKYESLNNEEIKFVNEIKTNFSQKSTTEQTISYLLGRMLYSRASELKYDLTSLPKWLFDDYLEFIIDELDNYQILGEVDSYAKDIEDLVTYLHRNIVKYKNSEKWQNIAAHFANKAKFYFLYSSGINLKSIYTKRREILEVYLEKTYGSQVNYEFPNVATEKNKIRLGILIDELTAKKENFTTLPVYERLNRDIFEIILYTFKKTDSRLEKYCIGHADGLIELPSNIPSQVEVIRAAELDILFISANITGQTTPITLLALHRLASIQIVDANSPVTTGMHHIDYYLSSQMCESKNDAQQHYTETLITLDTLPQCLNFATEEQTLPKNKISRQSLGINENAVIYISGLNTINITPEVQITWAKIIASVPNSILLLCNSDIYLQKQIQVIFSQHSISEDRLIIHRPELSRADLKELLQLGDVYLEGHPYNDMTDLIEPLEVALPVVLLEGTLCRFQRGASLLRSLELNDLITSNEKDYINLAITLGKNEEQRHGKKQQIQQKMEQNPIFFDSLSYSIKVEKLFQELQKSLVKDSFYKDFRLRDINLIIFPDWSQPEELLYDDLASVIKGITAHPEQRNITLLIDTSNITEEDADLAISSVVMNLLMEEDLEVDEGPEIVLVGEFSQIQWQNLLSLVHGKIVLENENKEAIGLFKAENLPVIELALLLEKNHSFKTKE